MDQPLLTIVTVTKNCAPTLDLTLRSVRAVKNDAMEYVIIDGVSTDGTLELVGEYGDLADVVVSEPDTGIYNAMNKGISRANGRYVLFINGDDELVQEGFNLLWEKLKSGNADVICCTTLVGAITAPDEKLIGAPWLLPFFNSIPHPSSFAKKTLLEKYRLREDLRIASDYDFFLRAFLDGCKFEILPAVTALHQRGGMSSDTERSSAEIDQIRRERLGWLYWIAQGIGQIYRTLKRISRLALR